MDKTGQTSPDLTRQRPVSSLEGRKRRGEDLWQCQRRILSHWRTLSGQSGPAIARIGMRTCSGLATITSKRLQIFVQGRTPTSTANAGWITLLASADPPGVRSRDQHMRKRGQKSVGDATARLRPERTLSIIRVSFAAMRAVSDGQPTTTNPASRHNPAR